jgi:hypothetical protein
VIELSPSSTTVLLVELRCLRCPVTRQVRVRTSRPKAAVRAALGTTWALAHGGEHGDAAAGTSLVGIVIA